MRLRQIDIVNFRSFAGKHSFDFYRGRPGFYFVTGRNKRRPKLGANGTGKTTLFEALYWCFYGKTSRNMRGGHVVNWDHVGGCSVTVVFRRADHEYMVRRSWKPNQLTLAIDHGNAETVDQPTLDMALGCDEHMFKHMAYLSQFGKTFFDLRGEERLSIFSQTLKLDVWLDYSRQAAEVVKEKEADRTRFAGQIEAYETRQREVEAMLKQIKRQESEFRGEKKAKIREAKDARREVQKKLKRQQHAAKELSALLDRAAIKSARQARVVAALRKGVDELASKVADLSRVSADAGAAYNECRKQYRRLNRIGDNCPVCLQQVEPKTLATHRTELKQELRAKRKQKDKSQARLDKRSKELEATRAEMVAAERALETLGELLQEARNAKRDATANTDRLKDELTERERDLTEARERSNPYSRLKGQQEAQAEKTDELLRETKAKLARSVEGHKIHSYWVDGFKRIRLKLIDQALREFEVEINAALDDLGMGDYTVSMDIERETKAGTVSRGFQLFITPPGQSTPVPWEAWSGGETQRLLLAGVMGLIGLVSGRAGMQTGFEIWDEPSHHLSGRGIDYLLAALETRSQRLRKQVWLIDHHTLEYGGFTAVTNVVMDKDGSHLEVADA